MNIIAAMDNPKLFGQWFRRKLLRGDTWRAWRVFLKALFAISLDASEMAIYGKHTGRGDVPTEQPREAWLVCGRRSGKSLIAAFIAVFLACFRTYEDVLGPGEVATIMVLACDKRQARTVMNYVNGFFDAIPTLGKMILSRTKESVALASHVRIEVHVSSFRSVRGYTVAAAVLDELAFFPTGSDSADPDTEIVNALRPAMATIPTSLLLGISSPYARRGVLWEAFRANYGKAEASALVWKATTREMNPTVSERDIRAAYEKDPASAAAEWGAEFRSDVAAFLPVELIDAAMVNARELPPVSGVSYRAFVDPSGGSSDSFTLAITHLEKERVVLDVVREAVPPFSPERIVDQYAQLLRAYRCFEVVGDRYAGEWPREQFAKRSVAYKLAELNRSELYLEMLPLLTAGRVDLLVNARLRAQLVALERRPSRLGRDLIDHVPGAHDDLANSVAGALVLAAAQAGGELGLIEFFKGVAARRFPDPTRDVPAKPSPAQAPAPAPADPESTTRNCSQCGGTMSAHAQNSDKFTCGSCSFTELISRVIAVSVSRKDTLARSGRFGRFGTR
jgi:ribosomal protein S27AE